MLHDMVHLACNYLPNFAVKPAPLAKRTVYSALPAAVSFGELGRSEDEVNPCTPGLMLMYSPFYFGLLAVEATAINI